MRMKGKIALVTGSSRGIGNEIAKAYIEEGAKVYLHGSKESSIKDKAEQLGMPYVFCDLADIQSVKKMVGSIKDKEHELHVLVNNAGFEVRSYGECFSEKDYDSIMNINLKAPYFLTQLLLPLLKEGAKNSGIGGVSIINVSSVHEDIPCEENGVYCMSKAAMKMMTQISAIELAKYNIRVNNFSPGAIETDMNTEIIDTIGRDKFNKWIAAGRVANCMECREPAIFLATEASSYMTGTSLLLDGGLSKNLLPYAREVD